MTYMAFENTEAHKISHLSLQDIQDNIQKSFSNKQVLELIALGPWI